VKIEMAKRLKVVIMTTKLPEDIWMINKVADVCDIEGIILPAGIRYREYGLSHVLKSRMRRLGLLKIADQALLILYRLIFESRKDKQVERELFVGKSRNHIEKKEVEILEVENANSEEVRNFLISKAPQLVVVSAAPLLRKKIIEAVKGRIINLHPGYAPEYRGRYGSFWPIYNGEPEFVGTTIHFIDEGIDTGAILTQRKIKFRPNDSLRSVTYRQHKVGVDLLIEVLEDFEGYEANAFHKTDCPNRNFVAPGLTHYLRGRWRFRRMRREEKREVLSGEDNFNLVSKLRN
jgi:folate-dependent phosphoribosylglycinamide formyltransferase PurN